MTSWSNRVKSHLYTDGTLDQTVMQVLHEVPRDHFVPEAYRSLSFSDGVIPLQEGYLMMPPRETVLMLKALQIKKTDHILVIGTGSGYVVALVAQLGDRVDCVCSQDPLTQRALEHLSQLNIDNVHCRTEEDVLTSWVAEGPYDVIVVLGSLPKANTGLLQGLHLEGRLFVTVGVGSVMTAQLITRTGENTWKEKLLFMTHRPPLINPSTEAFFIF